MSVGKERVKYLTDLKLKTRNQTGVHLSRPQFHLVLNATRIIVFSDVPSSTSSRSLTVGNSLKPINFVAIVYMFTPFLARAINDARNVKRIITLCYTQRKRLRVRSKLLKMVRKQRYPLRCLLNHDYHVILTHLSLALRTLN